ncbi:hypothetical protein [Kordia jejudonensis]|uniref:hypothetical protein n=1 Tax=Kordia jejudonensis TaxID=1348245 RepID=UPI0006291BD3|nr:hypothetical protein [Kordia jejudonensis]
MIQAVTKKNNLFVKYIHVILAVVCATAFFAHELLPDAPQEYVESLNNHKLEKKKRTILLNSFKKKFENSPEYKKYYNQKVITDSAWDEFSKVKSKVSFLGFEDIQQFIGEIGWALGLFLYALFNFINTFIEPNRARKSKLLLHITLLTIALYFIYWALYNYQDFEKITYFIWSLCTSIIIAVSVYFIIDKRYKLIKSYMLNIRDLVGFVLSNTKKDKESEMWDILKKIKHERD